MAKISKELRYAISGVSGKPTRFDYRLISKDFGYREATEKWNACIDKVDRHGATCPNPPKEGRPLCAVCDVLWRDEVAARKHWQTFGHPLPVGGI